MSIIDVLSSKVKSAQTKIEHFLNGRPTIQRIVEETIKVEEKKTKVNVQRHVGVNS